MWKAIQTASEFTVALPRLTLTAEQTLFCSAVNITLFVAVTKKAGQSGAIPMYTLAELPKRIISSWAVQEKVKFKEALPNEAAARVVMRELGGGQLINSKVAFDFGAGVVDVFEALKDMTSPQGEPYVDVEEEALEPAA